MESDSTFDDRRKRVAVLGPVAPYRSGVAKHTTELALALARRDDVICNIFSYRMLYPRFLYPGQSDRSNEPLIEKPTTWYSLSSMDPLSWYATVKLIRRFAPDLVVMPIWTFFVGPSLGAIARAIRRKDVPVVAIVHNPEDHEAAYWKARMSAFQLRQATAYITHNTALASKLKRNLNQPLGSPEVFVHPHPIFEHYPQPAGDLPRTAELELLFFGLLRPYKGLDIALRAIARTRRHSVILRVVGEFWSGLEDTRALIRKLDIQRKVELTARYVSDAEAAQYFARADAVLLPYLSVTGSGVVPVAYRYGKPVIVSDLPGLTEGVEPDITGWVVPTGDVEALASLIDRISAGAAAEMAAAINRRKADMTWETFASLILQAADSGRPPKSSAM